MAWQIKIHTLNVGQGDAQIIEVWYEVGDDDDKDYKKWINQPLKKDKDESKKEYAKTREDFYQAILIDGGPSKKIAEIEKYIFDKKILITKVLLTHLDDDHYEGLFELMINDYLRKKRADISDYYKKINAAVSKGSNKEKPDEIKVNGQIIILTDKTYEKFEAVKKLLSFNYFLNNEDLLDQKLDKNNINDKLNKIDIKIYEQFWSPLIDKFNAKPDCKKMVSELTVNFKNDYKFFFSKGGKLEETITKKTAIHKQNGLTKITKPAEQVYLNLGDDILGFNMGKLLIKKEQDKVDKPGLYLVAIDGKHYEFKTEGKLKSTPTNASSIGLLLVVGDFTYLTCGDLEDNLGSNENEINYTKSKREYNNLDLESLLANSLNAAGYNHIDFMKVGHHGSAASCSNYVLNAIKPKNVIISCGGEYDHGHPTREVIHRLNSKDFVTKIFLTNSAPRYGISKSWTNNIYKGAKFEKFENENQYLNYIKTLWTYKEEKKEHGSETKSAEDVKRDYEKKIDDKRIENNEKIFIDNLINEVKNETIKTELTTHFSNNPVYEYKEKSIQLVKITCEKGKFEISNTKFENKTIRGISNPFEKLSLNETSAMLISNVSTSENGKLGKRKTSVEVKEMDEKKTNSILKNPYAKLYNGRKDRSIKPNVLLNDAVKLSTSQSQICEHFMAQCVLSKTSSLIENGNDFSFNKSSEWIWNLNDMPAGFCITSLNGNYTGKNESYHHSQYSANAKATLVLNNEDTGIPITLTLITSNLVPYWGINLVDKKQIKSTIKKLATLADEDFMPYEIPSSLKEIFENVTEELTLNRFEGTFYANPDFSSKLNIDVSLNKEWTLIDKKLFIENIGFNLELEPDSIVGGVYGTIKIADKEVDVYVGMDTESTWALSISGKTKEDGTNEALPNLLEVGEFFLDDFKSESIPFEAKSDISVDSKLELTLIQMKVNFKAKNIIQELAINSVVTIKELKFNILLHVYPTWKIKGYMDTTTAVTVETVLNSFGLGRIDSIKDIQIKQASIEAIPKSKFYEIALALGNVSDFEIGGKKVELAQTSLTIRSNNNSISGTFTAKLVVEESSDPKCGCNDTDYIEDTIFEIEAALDENKTWQFKGALTGNISLEILTNWLVKTLGVSLPKWVQNLQLTQAAITFSTNGNYSFDVELYSHLSEDKEDDKQKLEITLHINKEKDKGFELSATVDIAYQSFVATIDNKNEDSKLKFEWKDKQIDSEITINDILSDLGLQDTLHLPDALDISFNTATIEFETSEENKCLTISASKQKESTKEYGFTLVAQKIDETWLYAFVLTIEKVNLHFNSLPLIGPELPENIGVNSICLLALSEEIKAVNNKLPEFIPNTVKLADGETNLQKGGYLNMQLDLGNGNSYPIQVSTASKKQKTKEEKNSLQLYGDEPAKTEEKPSITWKKIAKKVGPLQLNKMGFSFQNSELNLYFDAALLVGPLTLGLDELQLASPITKFDPHASLNGLSLLYSSSAVQIGGSFKKDGEESYSGSALIGTKAFQLAAIGAYAKIKDEETLLEATSLFVYAMLKKDLGGPSQFYIKGIAAGFGYNRNLLLPTLDTVKQYPFVAPFIGTTTGSEQQFNENTSVADASKLLKDYVEPRIGQQWFVAGIKFSTYNILDSVALLALKLGAKTEIDLIGFSEINFPKELKIPLIHAQLALVASILPDEGIAAVNAQLTAESYLFTTDCKLTGGFAFYLWFGNNVNSGDFVVTLGGYHPNFNVPSHYPQVPRLGFNWSITSELSIKGEMYFALTPKCIMAGGRFEANYQSGNFRAWFIMGADFMIAWKPYHYEANMYIVFGVVYQFRLNLLFKTVTKNISANFGAQLQVWGPDFTGTARIDLSVISFTVNFGSAQKSNKQTIDWNEFKTSFLPEHKTPASVQSANNITLTTTYCSSKAISGSKISDRKDIVQLGHENVVFEISTVIPSKKMVTLSNQNWEQNMGIKPAGITSSNFSSELKIEITKDDGTKINMYEQFSIREKLENVAGALWNDSTSENSIISNVLMGLYLEPKPKEKEKAVKFNLNDKKTDSVGINISSSEETATLVNIESETAKLFSTQGWI